MTKEEISLWLALLHLPKTSPRQVLAWLVQFSSIQDLFTAEEKILRDGGVSETHRYLLKKINWETISKELKWAEKLNHHIIPYHHQHYPPLLKEIAVPPLLLFVQGDPQVLSRKQIAMVGARHATFTGLKNAEFFAYALAKAGFVVTSGLARGIDGASHQGVLQAAGTTIAVFGTGLSCVYPKSNQGLAAAIIEQGGALVSEFSLETPPYAANFPRRNRMIAGLSLGVLVVEAALKSGSLITARIALEEGREVFAIPGTIHHPLSQGCHYLIKQGAKLVDSVTDILEEFGSSTNPANLQPDSPPNSPEAARILEQIDYEITPIDVILLRSQLTGSEISSILLSLELQGLIQFVSGGYVRIAAQKI